MERATSMISFRTLVRALSERSIEILTSDISLSSRERRRAKAQAKLGSNPGFVRESERVEDLKIVERSCIIEGTLTRGFQTKFAIDDVDFVIDEKSVVIGELELGSVVTVTIALRENKERYAKKVLVRKL